MKLSGKEKASYGLGAIGKDMVYMLSASYVLYYFQDVCGVSAFAMGIILLAARVFDAFNDPVMGVIVAKTRTRWGRFRPWLMIGTVPWCSTSCLPRRRSWTDRDSWRMRPLLIFCGASPIR